MRWWKQAIMAVQACITGYDRNLKSFQNRRATIITPEMESSHPAMHVQMRFRGPDTIKSGKVGISQDRSQSTPKVCISPNTEKKPRLLSTSQDKGSTKKVTEITVAE
jgi:hypothetical protein